MSPFETGASLAAVTVAFVISAPAGLGGSLVLDPALAFILGTTKGAALAAFLLCANNVVKLGAYRATIHVAHHSFIASRALNARRGLSAGARGGYGG